MFDEDGAIIDRIGELVTLVGRTQSAIRCKLEPCGECTGFVILVAPDDQSSIRIAQCHGPTCCIWCDAPVDRLVLVEGRFTRDYDPDSVSDDEDGAILKFLGEPCEIQAEP